MKDFFDLLFSEDILPYLILVIVVSFIILNWCNI